MRHKAAVMLALVALLSSAAWAAPKTPSAWYAAGMAAKKAGKLQEARKDLISATSAANWKYADAWWALAWVETSLGNRASAVRDFVIALGQTTDPARTRDAAAALLRLAPEAGEWRRVPCKSVPWTYWTCRLSQFSEPIVIGGCKGDSPLFTDCVMVPGEPSIPIEFVVTSGSVPAGVTALLSRDADLRARTSVVTGKTSSTVPSGDAVAQITDRYRQLSKAYHEGDADTIMAILAPDFQRVSRAFSRRTDSYDGDLTIETRDKRERAIREACWDEDYRPHQNYMLLKIDVAPDGRSAEVRVQTDGNLSCYDDYPRWQHTWSRGANGQGWLLRKETQRVGLGFADGCGMDSIPRRVRGTYIQYVPADILPTAESLAHLYASPVAREIKAAYEAWAAAGSAGNAQGIAALLSPDLDNRDAAVTACEKAIKSSLKCTRLREARAILRIVPSADGRQADVYLLVQGTRLVESGRYSWWGEVRAEKHTWAKGADGRWLLAAGAKWEACDYACIQAVLAEYEALDGQPIVWWLAADQKTEADAE